MTSARRFDRAALTSASAFVITAVTEILYPTDCRVCKERRVSYGATHPFCEACQEVILAPLDRMCQHCGAIVGPLLPTDNCNLCRDERFVFRRAFACHRYRSELKEIVLSAKKPSGRNDAVLLSKLLADRIKQNQQIDLTTDDRNTNYDAIVPVPADRTTHWIRPYQMCDVIADTLGRQLKCPVEWSALRKNRRTEKQAMISPSKRRSNVRGAFSCRRDFTGLTVLLVDDVMTTGSTANECAKVLKTSGASVIDVAVIARGDGT